MDYQRGSVLQHSLQSKGGPSYLLGNREEQLTCNATYMCICVYLQYYVQSNRAIEQQCICNATYVLGNREAMNLHHICWVIESNNVFAMQQMCWEIGKQ